MSKNNKILKSTFRKSEELSYTNPDIDGLYFLDLDSRQVWNDLDDLGAILSLDRLPEETNSSFKERIYDATMFHKNSSDEGLLYAAANELGFENKSIITVTCTNANLTAPNVIITPTRFKVYNHYVTRDDYSLAMDVPLLHRDYLTIKQLTDAIDSLDNFSCTINDEEFEYFPSLWLMGQGMQRSISEVILAGQTVHELDYSPVVPGSLLIPPRAGLKRELGSLADLEVVGDFYINYSEGTIITFNPLAESVSIYYKFLENPIQFRINGCGIVSLKDFLNDPFFFDDGLPKDFLKNLIIVSKNHSRQCWGE